LGGFDASGSTESICRVTTASKTPRLGRACGRQQILESRVVPPIRGNQSKGHQGDGNRTKVCRRPSSEPHRSAQQERVLGSEAIGRVQRSEAIPRRATGTSHRSGASSELEEVRCHHHHAGRTRLVMALVPIRIGELSALVEKPEPPKCSHPGCQWPDVARCCYPVIRGNKATTCGAKLCVNHGKPDERGKHYCRPHARLMERAK